MGLSSPDVFDPFLQAEKLLKLDGELPGILSGTCWSQSPLATEVGVLTT